MDEIKATFRIVTPMFLGGAEPNKCAELRTQSIKGALRFWYRAIDSNYRENEQIIFGSADKGQSSLLLTLDKYINGSQKWKKKRYKLFNVVEKTENQKEHSSKEDDTWTLNGNIYLGFSLHMGENERKAIPPGKEFTIKLLNRPNKALGITQQRGVISSIWLLGHIGGLGSRSRRGFGSIALQSWNVPDSWLDKNELPTIADGAEDVNEWIKNFSEGLEKIKSWFSNKPTVDHTVLGSNTEFYLFKYGYNKKTEQKDDNKTYQYEPWEVAMDVAGKAMQRFRQRWNLKDENSDYFRVKQHLLAKEKYEKNKDFKGLKSAYLEGVAPQRAAFGLPLTFRYDSLKEVSTSNTPSITFHGTKHDRNASPLFIRIVDIKGKCHPLFALLDAPLLESNEKIADQKDIQIAKRSGNKLKYSYDIPSTQILKSFCESVLKPEAEVIKW